VTSRATIVTRKICPVSASSAVRPCGRPTAGEVRDQQHEQAGVAVEEADEIVPRRLAHALPARSLHVGEQQDADRRIHL
jgi:hypothetical protein